ncbi:MAG: sulfur transferase domain-containing protein [Firmicutes bacterium]|nr:sulfur transferase domain-containing protein [Bacillota bacterium]
MKYFSKILAISVIAFGITIGAFFASATGSQTETQYLAQKTTLTTPAPEIIFVGPRKNIPEDAPNEYGFWSFAIPVPGVLSRSGQPLLSEFKWLKAKGWKSDINLRTDGERGEVGDDSKIKGFKKLGLNYLYLPIADGSPPTEAQAKTFLNFVTNPANQPAHVHCRGGIGRTGVMVALYRYSIQGWPMDKAIQESVLFSGGVSESQRKWLLNWAKHHKPGSYFLEKEH